MSGGPYHQFYHGHDEEDIKGRLASIERNISDIYNLLGGNSSLISTADDAEITALMQGSGAATSAEVRRGLDSVAVAQALETRGATLAQVRRMIDEAMMDLATTARGITRAEAQRLAEDAAQMVAPVRGISRAEVQKMINDAMVSVLMM